MKYTINNFVEFDSCTGILSLVDDRNIAVQLSKPGSRLLNEMITHSGITLTREELLQNVWENHGLIPSSNNLSNHISFLRKIFAQLGMDENMIITSPREGFRFAANVQTIGDKPCEQDERENEEAKEEIREETAPEEQPVANRRDMKKIKRYVMRFLKKEIINRNFITLSVIVLLLVFLRIQFSESLFFKEKNALSSVGLCHILDLESGKEITDNNKMNLVKKIITEKNINCVNKKSRIYLKITQLAKDTKHIQQANFLVQCLTDHIEKESQCENYLSLTLQKP